MDRKKTYVEALNLKYQIKWILNKICEKLIIQGIMSNWIFSVNIDFKLNIEKICWKTHLRVLYNSEYLKVDF